MLSLCFVVADAAATTTAQNCAVSNISLQHQTLHEHKNEQPVITFISMSMQEYLKNNCLISHDSS
jgi:hypothetical protein